MLTDQIADLLKSARHALGLSQKDVARRAQVSTRLWAEVERGERPNVSIATALRMLAEVGVTVRLTDPLGVSKELRDPGTATAARAARAAMRRATWTGRQIRLDQEGTEYPSAKRDNERLAGVRVVSEQAFAVARGRRPSTRKPASTRR